MDGKFVDYGTLYMYYDHDYEIASALQDLFFILPFGQILYQMSLPDVKLFGECHHL